MGTKGQFHEKDEDTRSLNTVSINKCRPKLQGPQVRGRVAIITYKVQQFILKSWPEL